MAKADDNAITDWISLRSAKALVVEAYGSSELAERLLTKWLGEGRVQWSCRAIEGGYATPPKPGDAVWYLTPERAYDEGDPAFWRTLPTINWDEGWARETYVIGGTAAYRIEVSRAQVLAQLSEEPGEQAASPGGKRWIEEEARRMKKAGEVPLRITDFSRELAQRMETAADADTSIRPLKPRSIENGLREWGLWPAASIK